MKKFTCPRLLAPAVLLSSLFLGHAARAQEVTPDLPIPVPPGAMVQFEIDARQEDLLGMAKSLVNGLEKSIKSEPKTATAMTAGIVPGEAAFFQQLLSQDFSKVLKDVNHVHIVGFGVRPGNGEPLDVAAFYESPWVQSGGRRMVWINGGPGQRLLVVGFNAPRGFAAVVQTPQQVFTVRADGYPDLEALAPIMVSLFGMRSSMIQPAAVVEARPMPPMVRSAPARPAPRIR